MEKALEIIKKYESVMSVGHIEAWNKLCSDNAPIKNLTDFADVIEEMYSKKDPHRFFVMPSEFEEVNVRIGENQPQFNTLPAYLNHSEGTMLYRFEFTTEQLEMIARTGELWFEQHVGEDNFQPVRVSTYKDDLLLPDIPKIIVIEGPAASGKTHLAKKITEGNTVDYISANKLTEKPFYHNDDVQFLIIDGFHRGIPIINLTTYIETNQQNGRCIIIICQGYGLKIEGAVYLDATKHN